MPAERCGQLFVGDAILNVNGRDLQSATHADAVRVLSRVYGDITMEVLYVDTEGSSDEENWEDDQSQRYTYYYMTTHPALLSRNLIGLSSGRIMLLLTNCEVHTRTYLDRSFEVWTERSEVHMKS